MLKAFLKKVCGSDRVCSGDNRDKLPTFLHQSSTGLDTAKPR